MNCTLSRNNICRFWEYNIDPFIKNRHIHGGIYLYPTQMKRIHKLIHRKVKPGRLFHVCETGFNAGHFASLVLLLSNDTQVTSFDLFESQYKRHIVERLRVVFGNRFRTIAGDTSVSIPRTHMSQCHMVHLSVPHREMHDLVHLYQHSFSGTIVTATSIHASHGLYASVVPQAHDLGIISRPHCEYVENVSSSLPLFFRKRNNNIHCWAKYIPSFTLSRTMFEFAYRVMMSRSGRGALLTTGNNVGGMLFRSIAWEFRHTVISLEEAPLEKWILLWVHHSSKNDPIFCRTFHTLRRNTTITYIVVRVHSMADVSCLFAANMRVYSLLSRTKAPPNFELRQTTPLPVGSYIFGTHGNDLAIPDEYAHRTDHNDFRHIRQCSQRRAVQDWDSPAISVQTRSHSVSKRRSLVVVLVDALSDRHFNSRFPKTHQSLNFRKLAKVQNYSAVGEHSGPNQAALYKTEDVWLWDELTKKSVKTLKIENTCHEHSALMKNVQPSTTHGVEFQDYFCRKKAKHDCIGNITSLDAMFDIAKQFVSAYENESYAAFVHVQNMHEETFGHATYTDHAVSEFVNAVHQKAESIVVLSDHGLHYGAFAYTALGQSDIWTPFAYHNLRTTVSPPTPHGMRSAIRRYMGLAPATIHAHTATSSPRFTTRDTRSIYPCRVVVPSVMSFFADTAPHTQPNACPALKLSRFHIVGQTILFKRFVNVVTATRTLGDRLAVNFTNADRYIVIDRSYPMSLPVTPVVASPAFAAKLSIVVIEVDTLSRMTAHRFFSRTRQALSKSNVLTNREFSNFNVVGEKSIPNQVALLSRCEHTYKYDSVIGSKMGCHANLFDTLKRVGFKTFFGEEFCTGKWSVRRVLNTSNVDRILDDTYCALDRIKQDSHQRMPFHGLCLGDRLRSAFSLNQLEHFLGENTYDNTFSFLSLITLHQLTKRQCKHSYVCWRDDLKYLAAFDHSLSSWIQRVTNSMREQKRPFLIIVKGDHGTREDELSQRKYADVMEHINPFLHILSNRVTIAANPNTLTTPFDLYDLIRVTATKETHEYGWEHKTCRNARIPNIFCDCPTLV